MWESIRDWALKEIGEVKRAPFAFGIVLALGVILGWQAGTQYLAERIEVLQLLVSAGRAVPLPEATVRPLSQEVGFQPWPYLAGGFSLLALYLLVSFNRQRAAEKRDFTQRALLFTETTTSLSEDLAESREALEAKKREYAMLTLNRYSFVNFQDGRKPRVTIRFCAYGTDYDIVKKIKEIFSRDVHWPVAEDASNVPPLPRAEAHKVVFDVGMTMMTYGDLVHAFSEGNLLGVTVGELRFQDRNDSEHLIIQVRPSAAAAAPAPAQSSATGEANG